MLVCDYVNVPVSGWTVWIKKHTKFRIFIKTPDADIFTQTMEIILPTNGDFQVYNNNKNKSLVSSDFNGDGRDDILIANLMRNTSGNSFLNDIRIFYPSTGATQYTSNTFTATEIVNGINQSPPIVKWYVPIIDSNFMRTGDFDGDGRTDFLLELRSDNFGKHTFITFPALSIKHTTLRTEPCNLNSAFNAGNCNTIYWGEVDNMQVGDFDGDGKHDIMTIQGLNGSFYSFTTDGSYNTITKNYYNQPYFAGNGSIIWIAPDFNGDRKTDIRLGLVLLGRH